MAVPEVRFERQRRLISETAVQTRSVIEALDVVEEPQPGRLPGGRSFSVEAFGFEGGPEALHHGVVVTVAPAVHAWLRWHIALPGPSGEAVQVRGGGHAPLFARLG